MGDSLTAPGTPWTLPSSGGSKNSPPLEEDLEDTKFLTGEPEELSGGNKKAEGV
jgi:hypothetical protein